MAQSVILAPLQLASVIGETGVNFVVLGNRGFARALLRKFSAKGRKLLRAHRYFTGDSVIDKLSNPGADIGDMISALLWAPLRWNQAAVRQNLLLAQTNKQEFEQGQIATERIVEISLGAGACRWCGMPILIRLVILALTLGLIAKLSGKQGLSLAIAFSSMALLQVNLWEQRGDLSSGTGSIFFIRNAWAFRLCSTVLGIILWVAFYKLSREADPAAAFRLFMSASLLQAPLYVVLKFILPGEVLLIPLAILGVGFSYLTMVA